MRKKSRTIIFIFVSLVLCGFIVGLLVWNKPHVDVKNAEAVRTDAISLYNSFMIDSAKAKSVFVNKVILVSGAVQEVSVNEQRQQIILLKTTVPGASVNCTMERNNNKIKQGDEVVIKGICSGYIGGDKETGIPGDVFLIRCYTTI